MVMDGQLRPISSSDAARSEKLLSLVTACLDDAEGLRATALSIARQTYQAYQWLVVDGGSTDGTREVLKSLEPLVDDWTSEPDEGVYDAMNRGLRRARGQYVMFLNAGDRLADAGALERIVRALLHRPGIDLLFAGTLLHLPTGRQVYRAPRAPRPWLRFGLPAYHQATVVRRAVHLATPFDLDLRISADYGVIATMMRRGARTARLDRPVVIRDCGPDNLSERETGTRFRAFVRVQREILERTWPGIAVSLGRLALVHLAYRMLSRHGSLPLEAFRQWHELASWKVRLLLKQCTDRIT
jgi:putative colanic acid biosynthesis glycosyltransferase